MTNEEIYKYADKKLKKFENKVLFKYMVIAFLGGIGILLMVEPLDYGCPTGYGVIIAGVAFILGISLLVTFALALEKVWFKKRRNYIYNLVRADERKRLQVSKR